MAELRLGAQQERDPGNEIFQGQDRRQPRGAPAISADNHWLVTGNWDGTARLWDLNAKDPAANPIVLRGHDGAVTSVAISPDNRWLVNGSTDKTARLWILQVEDLLDLARTTLGRNFFADEWQLYFPGEKYRKTFPDLPRPE